MTSDRDKEMMSIYTKRFYIVEERRKETEEKFTHDYPPPRKIAIFEHMLKKPSHPLLGAWSLLPFGLHSMYTQSRAQRQFLETRPRTYDHGKNAL